jgi:hypothetical protein
MRLNPLGTTNVMVSRPGLGMAALGRPGSSTSVTATSVCIFLAGLHRAERAIAARIEALSSGALPWLAIDAAKAITWVETKAGIALAESQLGAAAVTAIGGVQAFLELPVALNGVIRSPITYSRTPAHHAEGRRAARAAAPPV